jgi:hypothetical protein
MVLLSVDVIKFVFYIDILRPIRLMCAAISSRMSITHYNCTVISWILNPGILTVHSRLAIYYLCLNSTKTGTLL